MLDFGEEVFRIAVEFHDAHFERWIVFVWPHLSQIEGVVGYLRGLLLGHDLHVERPLRVVGFLDALVEVALMTFAVFANDGFGLGVGQVLDALL